MQVLSVLAESSDGLGVGEVAARTGLTTSTTHNLLATLAMEGFAERLSSPPRYRIGPAVYEISATQESKRWARALDAAVQDASQRLPEATVVQCELLAGEIVACRRCSPERPGHLQRPSHQAMSPYFSVSGLCWLAFGPPEDRLALERRFPLADYGGHRWASQEALTEYLASIRAVGHVADRADGMVRVSVPVFSKGKSLLATLGASIPASTMEHSQKRMAELAADLKDTAEGLSNPRQSGGGAIHADQ